MDAVSGNAALIGFAVFWGALLCFFIFLAIRSSLPTLDRIAVYGGAIFFTFLAVIGILASQSQLVRSITKLLPDALIYAPLLFAILMLVRHQSPHLSSGQSNYLLVGGAILLLVGLPIAFLGYIFPSGNPGH